MAATKITAISKTSTKMRLCWLWGCDLDPGRSSSMETRAKEALSVLLTGSVYWGPRGSTVHRRTLTFVSMSSIMRSIWLISRSMVLRSSVSRAVGRVWVWAWFRSGTLSARAVTSLPPPVEANSNRWHELQECVTPKDLKPSVSPQHMSRERLSYYHTTAQCVFNYLRCSHLCVG